MPTIPDIPPTSMTTPFTGEGDIESYQETRRQQKCRIRHTQARTPFEYGEIAKMFNIMADTAGNIRLRLKSGC